MEYESYGNLVIHALTAGGALPVEGAVVQIRGADENDSFAVYSLLTDRDGMTVPLSLPAPSRIFSESQGAKERAYADYDVVITADGYYPKRIYNVAVFDGVSAILPINMIPKSNVYNDEVTFPRGNLFTFISENEKLE